MRVLEIALSSACVALCPSNALAADTPAPLPVGVKLDVERGPDTEPCIDAGALERAVETRLHRAAFLHQRSAPLRIWLRLTRSGKRAWTADLRLESESGAGLGERTLSTTAPHCSALDDSLALVVALLVDAPLVEREHERDARRESPPRPPQAESVRPSALPQPIDPAPAAKPTPIDLPANTLAPRQPWRWELTTGASLAVGLLPGGGAGLEVGVSARPARGPELRLFAQAYAPRDAHAGPDQAGAHFDALFLGFEVCPLETRLGVVRVSACAGQNLGRLHAAAFGYDQNLSSSDLIYSLLARGVIGVSIFGGLSARLSARAEAPLSRPVFYYGARGNSEPSVFELRPVLGILEAGLSFAL